MSEANLDSTFLARLWRELGGPPAALAALRFEGPALTLPSVYQVSSLANASVAAATLAIAELAAARRGAGEVSALPVTIDRSHVAAAFQSERLLRALDWQLPRLWDPLAGDYPCRDGYIRLHTNYAHHRAAVLRVLGTAATREAVANAVAGWDGDALESAVVAANGCGAYMRSAQAWSEHPQGRALANEPLFQLETTASANIALGATAGDQAPLDGIRVLDLTRVIAGPICTRVLAAYGAHVLRIDPPGFEEVAALLCDVTGGKRRAALDLRDGADRARFEALLAQAHMLVHGYRADALARLGYDQARLRSLNPNLILICHDAYGWSGPWATRRGFDSLVQMSCGIAAAADGGGPRPLPVQALDHATGYLLAASACRALLRAIVEGHTSSVRLSLARTAQALMELGDGGDLRVAPLPKSAYAPYLETTDTQFGRVQRVRCPGRIAGVEARWTHRPGALGCDEARWPSALG